MVNIPHSDQSISHKMFPPLSKSSKYPRVNGLGAFANACHKAQRSKFPEEASYRKRNSDGWSSIWPDESNVPFIARRTTLDSLSPPAHILPSALVSPSLAVWLSPLTTKRAPATTLADERSYKRVKTQTGLLITLNACTGPATVLACADSGLEGNLPVSHSPITAKQALATTLADEQSHKRARTRTCLPLTLNANTGPASVLACADSGSEENIISLDLARALGYDIDRSPSKKRQFTLANGGTVEAVGEMVAECSFGIEATPADAPMSCVFYVFVKLASPIIMGHAFLEQTMTLSKHRHRLIRVPRPAHQPLQVYSVGRPRDRLFCYLNMLYVPALPDSGSEINLMTRSFAVEKGFNIQQGKEFVEFADGSVAVTTGVVRGELKIRKNESIKFRRIPEVKFHLLDNLRHDLIVGEDPLEELEIFSKGQHLLFPTPTALGPAGLNRIRHLGTFDHVLSWVKKKIGLYRKRQKLSISNGISVASVLADQQENYRREREEIRIAHLPIDQQESAIAAEALRQAQYDDAASSRL